jgi:transposase
MWHVGIDLHRQDLVVAAVDDDGDVLAPVHIACRDEERIREHFSSLQPFRCVVEATETYYWLYELLEPLGTVLLANTLRFRAMMSRRSKTDKQDALLLAQCLRMDTIPLASIPSPRYQKLRSIMRHRARLGRDQSRLKTELKALAARQNLEPPYKCCFGPRGLEWFRHQDFGMAGNIERDHILGMISLVGAQIRSIEDMYGSLAEEHPETAALTDIHGIGIYSALMIVGELCDPDRFRHAGQVGAYAGLTPRVRQSGEHCYHGHISKQGSPWLRWILIEAAIKVIRRDEELAAFYRRLRKRSSASIARVAVARKLVEICWKRLRRFQQISTA